MIIIMRVTVTVARNKVGKHDKEKWQHRSDYCNIMVVLQNIYSKFY